jgi:hypothetical protein
MIGVVAQVGLSKPAVNAARRPSPRTVTTIFLLHLTVLHLVVSCTSEKLRNASAGSQYPFTMTFPRESASNHGYVQSEAKRRRLRKGTCSCWECKRRKMRCIFDAGANTCNGCSQRGSSCVSQEFPEDISTSKNIKKTINSTHKRPSSDASNDNYERRTPTTPSDNGIPTPVSTTSEPSNNITFYKSFEVRILNSFLLGE